MLPVLLALRVQLARRALLVLPALQAVRQVPPVLPELRAPLVRKVPPALLELRALLVRKAPLAPLLRQYMHNTEIAVTMRLSTILKTIKQPL